MPSIISSIGSIGSEVLSLHEKKFKGVSKSALFAASVATHVATGGFSTITALYLKYEAASAAFQAISGYAAQYKGSEDGFRDIGFTPSEIGKLFQKQHVSSNSWNVLKPAFDCKSIRDIQTVLRKIHEQIDNPKIMQVMTAQILSKVLVGKNAHFIGIGNTIEIPSIDANGNTKLVEYTFDKKFDLWKGIPAFGLVDIKGDAPPMLIFRSTNTDLEEIDTLPTLVANLHPKGPGWKIFSKSQEKVAGWLEEKNQLSQQKARTIGYSQGGILSSYFLTYHSDKFNKEENQPSFILDAPGVSNEIEKDWLGVEEKPYVETYINRGDIIPKVGDALIGRAFEVRIAQNLKGFDSHKALSFFAPQWEVVEISAHLEKQSISRNILSKMHKVASVTYTPLKKLILPCLQGILHS
ncbi:MAG: hypothetical protein S4CHLAM6_15320 [Chlamydiae bacterium]|nr:hypothetical protein [Chlamydiota bacterium]